MKMILFLSKWPLFQMVCLFLVFRYEEKTVFNLLLCISMLLVCSYDLIDYTSSLLFEHDSNQFNNVLFFSFSITIYILLFKNRYKWEKQKSDKYDKTKVQAVFSKPDTVLTLLGKGRDLKAGPSLGPDGTDRLL